MGITWNYKTPSPFHSGLSITDFDSADITAKQHALQTQTLPESKYQDLFETKDRHFCIIWHEWHEFEDLWRSLTVVLEDETVCQSIWKAGAPGAPGVHDSEKLHEEVAQLKEEAPYVPWDRQIRLVLVDFGGLHEWLHNGIPLQTCALLVRLFGDVRLVMLVL